MAGSGGMVPTISVVIIIVGGGLLGDAVGTSMILSSPLGLCYVIQVSYQLFLNVASREVIGHVFGICYTLKAYLIVGLTAGHSHVL